MYLKRGNSQYTHSLTSSIRTSLCVAVKSNLFPAITIGTS